jgi:hypothetical protein
MEWRSERIDRETDDGGEHKLRRSSRAGSEGAETLTRINSKGHELIPIFADYLTVPFSRISRGSRLNDFPLAGRSVRTGWGLTPARPGPGKTGNSNREIGEPREQKQKTKSEGKETWTRTPQHFVSFVIFCSKSDFSFSAFQFFTFFEFVLIRAIRVKGFCACASLVPGGPRILTEGNKVNEGGTRNGSSSFPLRPSIQNRISAFSFFDSC